MKVTGYTPIIYPDPENEKLIYTIGIFHLNNQEVDPEEDYYTIPNISDLPKKSLITYYGDLTDYDSPSFNKSALFKTLNEAQYMLIDRIFKKEW